ncbi:MAG: SH3-like domain-containing protein [Flavobacteriia bacterium]|nr:SH3-like domain-containing protein [Flavobacteriia bacterium]
MKLGVGVFVMLAVACNNSGEVVETTAESSAVVNEVFGSSSSHSQSANTANGLADAHVKVLEQMDTDRYSYLKVSESNGREYWIAAAKGEFMVGAEYHYHDGIYKTEYYSTHFDRTFDEIYLVSKIHLASAGHAQGAAPRASTSSVASSSVDYSVEGGVTIAEIVANPGDYAGEKIRVRGNVTKVNPMIMGRNWVHLQDGTADDFDFVITTQEDIPVGHTATFEGTLNVNVDFGSGYTYEIIMEDAVLIRD